jgi:hypothetical protein
MHQSFSNLDIMMEKVSEVQKPYFLRYTQAAVSQDAYIRGLHEDMARTMDEFMKTCG